LRAYGEDVRSDARQRDDLAEQPGDLEQPRQHERADGDERHVLSRYSEEVVET
jgi:hypothetical protein